MIIYCLSIVVKDTETKIMIPFFSYFVLYLQLFPDFDYPAMKRNYQMYESIDKFINDCYDRRTAPETDPMFHKGEQQQQYNSFIPSLDD